MPERILVTDPGTVSPDPIASPLPDQITESIAIGNVKSVAEQPAMLSNLNFANALANVNLAQQNAAANQQAMNQLGITVTGGAINLIANLNPLEAVSASTILTGNVVAQELIDIVGAGQAT